MNDQFIPKDFMDGAQKLLANEVFKAVERALIARKPAHPNPADPQHKQAADAFVRSGFEKALDDLRRIPFEFEEVTTQTYNPLLDTRD